MNDRIVEMVESNGLTVNYGHSTKTYHIGNGKFTLAVPMKESECLAWLHGFSNGRVRGLVDGIESLERLAKIRN